MNNVALNPKPPKRIRKIQKELDWIKNSSIAELKKNEPRLDSLATLLRDCPKDHFPADEVHNLKIALYSFHTYCEQYKISGGFAKVLISFSVNSKANLIVKHTQNILNAAS